MAFKLANHKHCTVVVIMIYIGTALAEISSEGRGSDCSWIKCYNSGTVVLQDQQCVCVCPPGYSGILCEYGMDLSRWPNGPYALLMPLTGCPESETFGWSPGYINITTLNAMDILITSSGSVRANPLSESPTNLEGPFGNYTIQLNFCFKHTNWLTDGEESWPSDRVNVFGVAEGCPKGMMEELHVISLPPIKSWWSDGYLPYFEIHMRANGTDILTKHCKQDLGQNNFDMNGTPFIFVKDQGTNCTAALGIDVTEETLTFIDRSETLQTYTNISFCTFSPKQPQWYNTTELNETTNCQKPLGLTDGTIEDFQITSSSFDKSNAPHMARVDDIGWCPTVEDPNPYLQIDLFSIGLVGGITLYNKVNFIGKVQNNVYHRRLVPEGCRSFMISYGIYPHNLTNYVERPFIVDYSQVYEQPQTFKFLRQVLARYVRIYPLQPINSGRLCLRMELLGCSSSAKLISMCDKDSQAYWTPLSSITPASMLAEHQIASDNTSIEDCKLHCEKRIGECKAIQYITNKTCGLYSSPFPDSSLSTRYEPQTFQYLLVCQTESSIFEYIDIETSSEVNTVVAVIDKEVLTNYGFPMHYESNSVFKWTVTSAHVGFIRLTFAVIDFYERSIVQSTECPEDKLTFNEAFNPITSAQNGLTPTFPTDEGTVVMVFNTCARKYRRDDRRAGFRIFVKIEESPTIWSEHFIISDIKHGHILSNTLLGVNDNRPESQKWVIMSRNTEGPYLLTFWYFNIPCSEGSFLLLWDGQMYNDKLCNSQKKPERGYRTWYMIINFMRLKDDPDLREEIGFGAYFRVVPIFKSSQWLPHTDVPGGALIGQSPTEKGVHNVCSKELLKCFRYSRLGHEDFTDWVTHAKLCQRLGYHQIVIHNRKEKEFLQALLLNMEKEHLKSLNGPNPPYLIYTHIGLIRYHDTKGLNHVWEDGTSVTFSACHMEDADTTVLAKFKDLLFDCKSTEWVVYTAVCDGISDCYDGSDEANCNLRRSEKGCLTDEFACGNSVCIHIGSVCNYVVDCPDGSDEYCMFPECEFGEYPCVNKQCVPEYTRCDAVDDCFDGSDERFCETCNNTIAFSCGDLTCVPKPLVCNGIPDCSDGRDEIACTKTYQTCYDYWKDGYNRNLTMNHTVSAHVPPFFLECQFYWVETHMLGIVSVLDWTWFWSGMNVNLMYAYVSTGFFKDHGQKCTFEISERCKYHLSEIASYIDPAFNDSYDFCRPKSVNFYTDGYFKHWKRDTNQTLRDIMFDIEGDTVNFERIQMRHIDFKTSVLVNISTTIGPVVCTEEYFQTNINCGDGMTVAEGRRCLYELARSGIIDGCRNFKHLEDCKTFVCPFGYIKCPSSFCLAQRFVCDGERQCPGGEDEISCWDAAENITLVVVFHKTPSDYIKSVIYKFARQLYSSSGNLYALGYIRQNHIISGNIRLIHPYNEALNFADVSEFETERHNLTSEIINYFANQRSITIINLDVDIFLKHLSINILSNISAVDHVYNVRVDETIQQQATTTHSEKETLIVVKSIDILASAGSKLLPLLKRVLKTDGGLNQFEDAMAVRRSRYFKCISSDIHIPPNQTCDGIFHCPFGDDEAVCDFHCLEKCSCKPYIANCLASGVTEVDIAGLDSTTRVLDISNNTVFKDGKLSIPKQFPFLIKLYAKHCKLSAIEDNTLKNTPSLIHIDLSFNAITALRKDVFVGLKYIKVLNLQGNTALSVIEPTVFRMLSNLKNISITKTKVSQIMASTFSGLTLDTLDISNNEIHTIHAYAFNNLTVGAINFERNEIADFDAKMFFGVQNLSFIRSPSFKFCCYKPSSVQTTNCLPHEDEFSSCEDLMRNSILQTLLWMIGVAAVVANGATIAYRLIQDRRKVAKGFRMFVLHLAASDFLMGIYLIIIATADLIFRNRYILEDDDWRKSFWCNAAGILATVSSEASVGFMCLITVERFLVIKFPFGQWKFSARVSAVAVTINWIISLMFALMPIMIQDYFEDSFYSTSGVCLAMPLTSRRPPGWLYSFVIFVAVNFVAFILIAIGQLAIYMEIRKSSKRMEQYTSQRRNDMSIARNLLLVLTTDFLCWFPIGVMAIMAYDGYSIPGDVYAWTAVLILPVNSALNPFLYTLSAVVGLQNSQNKADSYETTKKTGT